MIEALRAAGEPTRLRILGLLAREELSVMELCRILDQSQPRVSRHLKLMADAGLVERFPEGPRVFYRLGHDPAHRALTETILSLSGGPDERDAKQLEQVRRVRESEALAYFERVAPQWDQLRSLYLGDSEVEAAILEIAGEGPFRRLVDLGTGSGRMLALLGHRSRSAVGLDLSQNMLSMARLNTAARGLAQVELRQRGPEIENDPVFPERINIHVAAVRKDGVHMRSWERGAGLTLACGTGACATAVAAIVRKRAASPVAVHMPGGSLTIAWQPGQPVRMRGAATHVFQGTLDTASLT